eukprot:symbB.v1.2.019918.t1/scaffold1650.1/size135921/7
MIFSVSLSPERSRIRHKFMIHFRLMIWSQLPVEYWQPKRSQRIVMWEDEDERLEEEEEQDYFPDEWDEAEAKAAAWQEQFKAAIESGETMIGLPQGLRMRPGGASDPFGASAPLGSAEANEPLGDAESPVSRRAQLLRQPLAARRCEFMCLALLCVISALCTLHFSWTRLLATQPADWRQDCQQCQKTWWQDFWRWRYLELSEKVADGSHEPPPGMQWEWGGARNDTDWYQASEEFVQELVRPYADPSLGPVLHVGCGDAPVPEHLHRAGFPVSVHLDVAKEVIDVMKRKYPAEEWPGFTFLVRDFLGQGAPAPLGGFCAVLDKAGIWDWLQEEAPQMLPMLLRLVRQALPPPPAEGVYILATKLSPVALAHTLEMAQSISADGTQRSDVLPFHVRYPKN